MRIWTPVLAATLATACNSGDETTPTDTAPTDPGPTEIVDLLPQQLHDPVDILFVLDATWNDGLKGLDAEVLNQGFETLLLSDTAWRVGMLDASASGSSFGLLGPKFEVWPLEDPPFDPPGSAAPKFRESIYTALELRREQEANSGFLRAEGALYILLFTDKTDATDDLDDGITQRAFEEWLDDFDRSGSVRLGVFTTPQRGEYWRERTYGGGTVYEAGAYRKGLQVMFRDAIGQRTVFALSHVPTEPPAKVDIIYRDHRTEYFVEQDYLYDPETNSISFINVVPKPDSVVRVIYETEDEVVDEATPTGEAPAE